MSDIIEITDFEDPKLDVYARTKEIQLLNRANPEDGIFIAEKSESSGAGTGCGVRADFYSGGKETRRRRSKTDHKNVAGRSRCIRQNLMC